MGKNVVASDRGSRSLMFRWALWFILANAVALMLISLNYLKFMQLPDTLLAQLFLSLSYPGHYVSLAMYVFPFIAAGILVYPRRRFVFGLSIFLELALVLTVTIDSLVFAQYRFHLNGMVWNLITSGAAGDVLPVTGFLWLVLFLAIIFIALCEWLLAVISWRWVLKERRHYGVGISALIAFVILVGHGMHAWADVNHYTSITSQTRYLPAYKPLIIKRLMTRMGFAAKDEASKLHLNADNSALHYPLETVTCLNTNKKKMNLLLVVIDSWRFDALTPEITPNLWAFSKVNLRFDNHFSSGNCTRFGIFGLFYGLYSTYWHAFLAEERSPVLMQEMEKQSYRMGIFASAPLVSPEFDRTVFADIRSQIDLQQEGERPYQWDRVITDKMLHFIATNPDDTPFFGFLFYDAPHAADHPEEGVTPFQPALAEVNHLALNNSYDPLPLLNKYKNSLHYVDAMVQEVLAALLNKGLLDSTIVVVTGDHGQEFNDLKMNYWGHNGNFSRFQTQTPMVVHWPGKASQVFTHTTSHLDMAPTLMQQMLGCTNNLEKYSNGRYLFDTTFRPYVLASSWDTFGVIEPDKITVSLRAGDLDILDNSYRPLVGAKIQPEITRSAMEGIGKFFAR